ncbi:MAG: helix-turn-helix transcriptional regulator [Firmicutes bacterium]|nr:helix-turn-helix transcriptional regulator [Bacillota bacterium]
MQLLYLFIREKDLLSQYIPHFHTIEKIINHIESNFTKTYSVEELARMAGLSPSHFRLLFKRVTGFSVTQYQINMKINKAKDLLISGACNVSEAAYLLGFNNIYYFSRLFKKNTGVNPSDYLKGYGS